MMLYKEKHQLKIGIRNGETNLKHCIAQKTEHRPALVASCLLSLHLVFSERAQRRKNQKVCRKKRHNVYITSKLGTIDQRFQSCQPFQS